MSPRSIVSALQRLLSLCNELPGQKNKLSLRLPSTVCQFEREDEVEQKEVRVGGGGGSREECAGTPRPLKICDRWSTESQKLTAPGRNILPPRKFPQGAADLPDHQGGIWQGGRSEGRRRMKKGE